MKKFPYSRPRPNPAARHQLLAGQRRVTANQKLVQQFLGPLKMAIKDLAVRLSDLRRNLSHS